jgi:hypothetical protein
MGAIQRDGVLALAGYVLAALNGGVLALAANLIARIAVQALEACPLLDTLSTRER